MVKYEWTKELCLEYANNLRPMLKFDHKPWAGRIATQINSTETGLKILDIATGPGFLLIEVAKLLFEPILFAQDSITHMLEIAGQEANNNNLRIEKIICDAHNLEIEDNSLDVVTCKQLLHEVENPEKIITEIYRVLKPGGKAFIIDFDADGSKFAAKTTKLVMKGMSNKTIANNFMKSFKAGLKGKDVKKMIENAGFSKSFYKKAGFNYFQLAKK